MERADRTRLARLRRRQQARRARPDIRRAIAGAIGVADDRIRFMGHRRTERLRGIWANGIRMGRPAAEWTGVDVDIAFAAASNALTALAGDDPYWALFHDAADAVTGAALAPACELDRLRPLREAEILSDIVLSACHGGWWMVLEHNAYGRDAVTAPGGVWALYTSAATSR